MSDVPFSTATLDPEDQAILGSLQPEGAEPGTPAFGAQTERELDEQAARQGASDVEVSAPATAPAAPAPAPAAPAAAPIEAAAPAPAAPAPAPAQAEGDVKAALRHARRNEKRLADQLADTNRRLAELEAQRTGGNANAPATAGNSDKRGLDQMTEEEIADLRDNFPLQYAMLEEIRDLRAKVAAPGTAAPGAAPAPAQAWEPTTYAPEVQEVIDEVPTLLRWQLNQSDQDKFNLAATFDTSLRADPTWASKTPVERFAEAVRLTELRLGLTGSSAAAPAPAGHRVDPATAIANAPSTQAAGVSDFRGGGTGGNLQPNFHGMSDEQILGSLRPEA